jgi:hypothetical protein
MPIDNTLTQVVKTLTDSQTYSPKSKLEYINGSGTVILQVPPKVGYKVTVACDGVRIETQNDSFAIACQGNTHNAIRVSAHATVTLVGTVDAWVVESFNGTFTAEHDEATTQYSTEGSPSGAVQIYSFSVDSAYNEDDLVYHNGQLWRALATLEPGAFDSSQFIRLSIDDYDAGKTYNTGDLVNDAGVLKQWNGATFDTLSGGGGTITTDENFTGDGSGGDPLKLNTYLGLDYVTSSIGGPVVADFQHAVLSRFNSPQLATLNWDTCELRDPADGTTVVLKWVNGFVEVNSITTTGNATIGGNFDATGYATFNIQPAAHLFSIFNSNNSTIPFEFGVNGVLIRDLSGTDSADFQTRNLAGDWTANGAFAVIGGVNITGSIDGNTTADIVNVLNITASGVIDAGEVSADGDITSNAGNLVTSLDVVAGGEVSGNTILTVGNATIGGDLTAANVAATTNITTDTLNVTGLANFADINGSMLTVVNVDTDTITASGDVTCANLQAASGTAYILGASVGSLVDGEGTANIDNFVDITASGVIDAGGGFNASGGNISGTDIIATGEIDCASVLTDLVSTTALRVGIVTTTSSSYTVLSTDHTILCDSTSAAITINLEAAATAGAGRIIVVKKTVAANTVTIDGSGTETIDGALTQVLTAQWTSLTIQCDGTSWFII